MGLRASLHAATWDVRSRTWGNWFSAGERERTVTDDIDWFVNRAGSERGRTLDIACGTGDYSFELASRGFSVVGCDFSGGMLARARARLAQAPGLACTFRRADFNNGLRAKDGSFDHAVCIWALQHAREPGAVLVEVARVLKPRGLLLLVTPATPWQKSYAGRRRRGGSRRLVRRALRQVGRSTSGRRFTASELYTLLGEVGFEVVDQRATRRYTEILAQRQVTAGW